MANILFNLFDRIEIISQEMIALFLSLVASATDATFIKDHIAGNWSATLTHPSLQNSEPSHYQARVVELPTKSFEVSIFEDESSVSPLTTFSISFLDGSRVSIKSESESEEDATSITITLGMRYHLTSVGTYKQYVFNFNLASPGRILITLFDNEKDEMTTIHLLKDIPQKSFFQKYGMTIFAVVAFGVSMILNFKFKPNMAAQPQQQPRQQQPKQAKTETVNKEEKKESEEKVEEVKDEANDQKKNTRDDEDENGKVKTE